MGPTAGRRRDTTTANYDYAPPATTPEAADAASSVAAPAVADDFTRPRRRPLWRRVVPVAFALIAVAVGSFELVYAGKAYPGVVADGVSVQGLSRAYAVARIEEHTQAASGQVLALTHGQTAVRIPVNGLGLRHDAEASATQALAYGRQGSLGQRVREQFGALVGRSKVVSNYVYEDASLASALTELWGSVDTPVSNASIGFRDGQITTSGSKEGTRVNLGRLTALIEDRLGRASDEAITVPVYGLEPAITSDDLKVTAEQAKTYLSTPLRLSYGSSSRELDQATIAEWINVSTPPRRDFLVTKKLDDLYAASAKPTLGLSEAAVAKYVDELATRVDQPAQNADLAMRDGQLAVTRASRDGVKIDRASATTAITEALGRSGDRDLTLKADVTRAEVREDNLEALGIKEKLSEGVSLFPGSTRDRVTNVRTGAAKFNGVLLKPGETFSFGKLLGQVDASTGYVPELVILNKREEKQYGGGLCQVSSTAFRAALNAGLPITERHNHSFAISYYTAPFGVPGVDATIYYPQVDFKFRNDTPGYLLIQTTMVGTNLKFEYFGTKTKSGTIRGPEFISGDMDHTKPSKTVFYRDVLDLEGKVTKTDAFYTNYQSSLDFPVTPSYN